MKFVTTLFVLIVATSSAFASDDVRSQKIAKIIEAQGLLVMFEDQLVQQSAMAKELGRDMFKKMLAETPPENSEQTKKAEAAFARFTEQCSKLWTAQELVAIWTQNYGQGLTDKDLDTILAYYTSQVGKKDVEASKKAMSGFSQVMLQEGRARMNKLFESFMTEIKEACR